MCRSFQGKHVTTIAFHADGGYAEVLVDHEATIRLAGSKLSAGGPVLAHLEKGVWLIGGQRLNRITCHGRFLLEIVGHSGLSIAGLTELCLIGELAVAFDGPIARYDPNADTWLEASSAPKLLAAETRYALRANQLRPEVKAERRHRRLPARSLQ
jgi:hypothetical protein